MHRSRNNRHCRPEFAPAHAICCRQARRALQHLSSANFAPNRADGRDRRRLRSAPPARSAPAALRAFYGAKPSPSPSNPKPYGSVMVAFSKGAPTKAQLAEGGSSQEEVRKCAEFVGCNVFAKQVGAQTNYPHIARQVTFLMIDAI